MGASPLGGDLAPLQGRSIMEMSWETLTFAHWAYDPSEVQALLPPGLTVETFEDKAWVGLIPFRMIIRPPGLPSIPWATRFYETNVRTYVTASDGSRGVWFFSLDASRLAAVVLARLTYKIPYFWASMSMDTNDDITYKSLRYWPKPKAETLMSVRVGEQVEPTQLDYFLTARDTLFSQTKTGFRKAHIFHEPWPLQEAELLHVDDTAVTACGLSKPLGKPVVRYSKEVRVSIGLPTKVFSGAAEFE